MQNQSNTKNKHQRLFTPNSIVVIGGSNDDSKPGGRVLKHIIEQGYTGSLWVINPKGAAIKRLPTYGSIELLPETPDLAIIAIPARFVEKAMEDLERKGVKTVIVLTAGFGEKDAAGKRAELDLCKIADRAGMTLVGPNCVGILTPSYGGKFAGIMPKLVPGTVDFISCSGATVDQTIEEATARGLSFCNIVTTGNSTQQGVEDILALMDDNYGPGSSPTLLLYMESIKKPKKLLKHARSLTDKGCTVVGIKSGVTEAGARAAASHTGAIATNDTAVDALFEKAGIIRAHSKVELIDIACVLSATHGSLDVSRVCIITDAGGPGVMLSDELNRQGLDLPILKDETQSELSAVLPPESPVGNPIDCLPSRNGKQIRAILNILEKEKDNFDVIVIITSNSMLQDNWDTYEAIIEGMNKPGAIPIIPVLSPTVSGAELIDKFKSFGKLYFRDEVAIGKALGMVAKRGRLAVSEASLPSYDKVKIETVLNSCRGVLTPRDTEKILNAAGIKLPAQMEVFAQDALKDACEQIGYPLVMKVIGPLHKSDAGGVQVGIKNSDEARSAWKAMLSIEDAKGVLLQPMIEGHEVILGVSREGEFGHLIMFGLGGIYTELFKDVRFALAPLSIDESLNMVKGIKCYPMLEGIRGERGMSINLLTDFLLRLSQLVTDFPIIREIDLNPIKGYDADLYAIDARIIIN